MTLGEKLYQLRKNSNLTQEQLSEKVGVSRQTISKWELDETAPDIKQAQLLSRIFNISLDELTGNDTKEVIYEKVSNTEKLAGMVIKILKVLGVLIIGSIVVTVISIIALTGVRNSTTVEHELTKIVITENLGGEEECIIEIGDDGSFNSKGLPDDIRNDIIDLIIFEDLDKTQDNIKKYFIKLREEQKE